MATKSLIVTFSTSFFALLVFSACDMNVGDPEQNTGATMHEVYLAGHDGQETTLGYYDAANQMFYESATLDRRYKSVFIRLQDNAIALFPHSRVDNQPAILDVNQSYAVYTYLDQSSENPADWERLDLGVAHLDSEASPQSIDIEHKRATDSNVGSIINFCKVLNSGDTSCEITVVDDRKVKDDNCVGGFDRADFRDPDDGGTGDLPADARLLASCDAIGNTTTKLYPRGQHVPREFYVALIKDKKEGPGRDWEWDIDVRVPEHRNRWEHVDVDY